MSAILLVQTAIVSNFYSSHFVIDDIDLNRSSVLRLLLSYLYLLHTSSPLLQNTTDVLLCDVLYITSLHFVSWILQAADVNIL